MRTHTLLRQTDPKPEISICKIHSRKVKDCLTFEMRKTDESVTMLLYIYVIIPDFMKYV